MDKNKPIIVIKSNDRNLEEDFIKACEKIYNKQNDAFCGIDFEFNNKNNVRSIGSMQIIFIFDATKYYDIDYEKPVYILNPMKLRNKNLFIKYILCSKVTKIFHGSDSLDYPHIYNDILHQNNDQFIKFINHSIDTRFMCEISKRIMKKVGVLDITSNKCSIYNALYDHMIIDQDMFNKLESISAKINYNKPWIIDKLTENQLIYSAYDVMYLYDLVHVITKSIIPTKSNNILNYDPISVVNRLYRYYMLNRLNIIDIDTICRNISIADNNDNIMKIHLMTIDFVHKNTVYKIDLTMGDFLFIDTMRKTILSCLRVYNIDNIAKYFNESHFFNMLKGNETIKKMFLIATNIKI